MSFRRVIKPAMLATITMTAVGLAARALAGGVGLSVETAPPALAEKGVALLVHTNNCGQAAFLPLEGTAEGLVGGRRRSLPLRLERTPEPGVYALAKQWPDQGAWVLRISTTRPHAATALVKLAAPASTGLASGSNVRIADVKLVYRRASAREVEACLRDVAGAVGALTTAGSR